MRWSALRVGFAMVLAMLGLMAAGCAGSDDEAATTTAPATVPQAQTQAEWIDRLVNRYLLDMQENLNVVNGLRRPQVQIYLRIGNKTTIRTLNERMRDLEQCSRSSTGSVRLPPARHRVDRIYGHFRKSCRPYEKIARATLAAVPLLSSGDPEKTLEGEKEFAKIADPSFVAAKEFAAALELLGDEQPAPGLPGLEVPPPEQKAERQKRQTDGVRRQRQLAAVVFVDVGLTTADRAAHARRRPEPSLRRTRRPPSRRPASARSRGRLGAGCMRPRSRRRA